MKHIYFNFPRNFNLALPFLLLFTLLMSFSQAAYSQCQNQEDYEALRALYLSTDGDRWIKKAGWPNAMYFRAVTQVQPDIDMNDWHGVTCQGGRVAAIDLSNNNLVGRLPIEFESVSRLNFLNLSKNKLTEPGFEILKNIPTLLNLNLSFNDFSGPLTADFYELKNISFLYLQNNNFLDTISHLINDFVNLRELDLSRNRLKGQVYLNASRMTSLNKLNLRQNAFEGEIPIRLFLSQNLKNIDLSYNNFSGCYPEEIGLGCTSFAKFDLSGNFLLPWEGDYTIFCQSNYTIESQIGAPCHNGNDADGRNDVIKDNCMCGDSLPMRVLPKISGRVFVDIDANGVYGGNDIPLGGVTVALYPDCDRTEIPITVNTGYDGVYTFTDLPFNSNRWLVQIDPNSDVQCAGPLAECIELPLYIDDYFEWDFPCTPPDCTSNPFSIDNICELAFDNPLCDLRVIQQHPCGQNPSERGPWEGRQMCNGETFQNTSFYGFVAGTGDYQINFTILGCAGSGVQYGVFDACEPNGGPICDGNANTGTVTIDASELIPCRSYVFWINGFAGSVCSYYTYVTGDWNNCSAPDVADLDFNSGCVGAEEPYCPSFTPRTVTIIPDENDPDLPPIEDINDARYLWTVGYPSGQLVEFPLITGPEGITQDIVFSETGIYEVCVTLGHPCYGDKPQFCKQIEFAPIPAADTTFYIPIDDFPWNGAFDDDGNPILDRYGYPWRWEGGEVSLELAQIVPPMQFENFNVDSCGCLFHQTFRVLEEGSTHVIDLKIENFKLYPNPTRQTLNIESKDGILPDKYEIVNVMGQTMHFNGMASVVDVSHLPNGVYLLQFDYKNEPTRLRFIKN